MLNDKDQENLANANYAAKLLVQNLNSIIQSTNPLLADTALEILQQATQIEQRLNRIGATTKTEENTV